MCKTIISVDMDAFFASVEIRDNPELAGKPLIIGALPHERGVVSTCSYEARKFGVHSAMSVKEAYRLCPQGIFMHPSLHKYQEASEQVHKIWSTFTDLVEYISLDEGFLDVTGSLAIFGRAKSIGNAIKQRTRDETGLTCSVGIGYSIMSAKLASEEKKPDGLYEIPSPEALKALILHRGVQVIYGVGPKTAEKLRYMGILTVRDLLCNKQIVVQLLGNHGREIVDLAEGVDNRRVMPYYESESKSLGREQTFQHDTADFSYLKDVLRLVAKDLSLRLCLDDVYARTVTIKVKFSNMRQITRSKSGDSIRRAEDIYQIAAALLDTVEKRSVRLIGISLSGFSRSGFQQLTLDDLSGAVEEKRKDALDSAMLKLQRKYGGEILKTGHEMIAEKRFEQAEDMDEQKQADS